GVAAEAIAGFEAAEEGRLHEVFGAVVDLVAKESEHGVEVALEQALARSRIAPAPRCQQFAIVHGATISGGQERVMTSPTWHGRCHVGSWGAVVRWGAALLEHGSAAPSPPRQRDRKHRAFARDPFRPHPPVVPQ